ncbi:PEGA domain-containing protein [Patescibacteria group bacterium]|nr:PEGA domain-containing protein [Patescibacteria group bacterium]MCG2702487.1 PEGA domain-containing protein [Candidatus Parcubacteria bacterium]MBU4265046.1 PEGA domain-containing protein [Patescibacteria group bacterium]MBU4390199.1 PEGA domain-containing protein [Patescibacteria group bacterium]MBU4396868.1 PEGA domain-containing protein [Patescibacteria group bacterium]
MKNINKKDLKGLAIIVSVLTVIILFTSLISLLARGYRPNFKKGFTVRSTGLISATSTPQSASVYINDRLITATDDTINLPPDDYHIKIQKDGFLPWEKDIKVIKEVVTQTNVTLFKSSPELKPLSLSGAINPVLNHDKNKIVFSVASASASKNNGLYLIELNNTPMHLNKIVPKQLSSNSFNLDWSKASFEFSPDSKQILAQFANNSTSYLLSLDNPIVPQNLYDITHQIPIIKKEWQEQEATEIETILGKLPKEIRPLISTASAQNIQFSSSETKILYLASSDQQISDNIITPPPSQSTQAQQRKIQKDYYYVYDIKDDTNFQIANKSDIPSISWIPNSNNLVFVQEDKIKSIEYDRTNQITLFAGNFDQSLIAPLTNGQEIVTLTSAYDGAPKNLYSIGIR